MLNTMAVSQTIKNRIIILYDTAILLLGFYSETLKTWRDICTHMFLAVLFLSNILQVEAIQVSIHGWMDKGNVVYTYIQRILFKRKEIKKEGNSHPCYTMDDT